MANDDFWYRISEQNRRGVTRRVISAYSPDIDSGDVPMDLHPFPAKGFYAFQTAAAAWEVLSSSAADTNAAGTGLRKISITTLDSSFVESTQIVNLNGVTPVALSGTHIRVNGMFGTEAGSGGENAGLITLRVTAGAIIQSQILVGEGTTRVGVFTIPAGKFGTIMAASFDIERSTADTMRFYIMGKELSVPGPRIIERDFNLMTQGGEPDPELRGNRLLGPRDIWVRVVACSANNNRVTGRVFLVLEDA